MHLTSDAIMILTRNEGKLKEFQFAFAPLGKRLVHVANAFHLPEVVEDGDTFKANALKKAKETAEAIQLPVLADDSGLCVDRLDGAPGVYSARYAGEEGSALANNEKLLAELSKLPAYDTANIGINGDSARMLSKARFVCCLVLYEPIEQLYLDAWGTSDGYIIDKPRGTNGFGYDPLFYVPTFKKTMAELTLEQKQSISHRGQAIRKLLDKMNH